jgi:amidase
MVNAVAGLAGLPQISLPLATAAGVPVGISVLAGRRQDEALLDLASALSGGQMKRAGGMA